MRTINVNLVPQRPINKHLVYNGLDCLITFEVAEVLDDLLKETSLEDSYQRSLGELAVAMRMGLRGILVDQELKEPTRIVHEKRIASLTQFLNEAAMAVWQRPLNEASHKQMKEFWFGLSPVRTRLVKYDGPCLGCRPLYTFKKGERKLSTDRAALEKLSQRGPVEAFFANLILRIRDLKKEFEVFDAKLSTDGRMRCALNVAGTDTFRWSSNETPEFEGRNMQNISAPLRNMFVADKGKKLAYVDLEQAESRLVAYITGDENYIAACEGGDLHTTVCHMVWPELDWPADMSDLKAAKTVAEQLFYRTFTYRDMSKRGGHGTNYYGKPPTMAKHLNVETAVVRAFQEEYFEGFPGIPEWHERTRRTLLAGDPIVTAMGRHRRFYGRANDEATLRAAIAYEPQSTLSSIVKQGHVNLARLEDSPEGLRFGFRIMHDLHDAVVFDYYEEAEAECLAWALPHMLVPVKYPSGDLIIPVEAATGWSWGYPGRDGSNPNGLQKWKGSDSRIRQT